MHVHSIHLGNTNALLNNYDQYLLAASHSKCTQVSKSCITTNLASIKLLKNNTVYVGRAVREERELILAQKWENKLLHLGIVYSILTPTLSHILVIIAETI